MIGNKIHENYNEFSLYNSNVVIEVLEYTNAEENTRNSKLRAVLMNSSIILLLHCMLNQL
jgi:flagellar biosynthesis regulator FlaF